MSDSPKAQPNRDQLRSLNRESLEQLQLEKLNRLLSDILPTNAFYAQKLSGHNSKLSSLDCLSELPFTTKDELAPNAGTDRTANNLTYDRDAYVRYHQTSGTRGRPMAVLDTAADWSWWIDCWQFVLDAADVQTGDRALLAFSFGPFVGFWSAFDALTHRGALAIPGGGLSTVARLDLIEHTAANCLCCTPSYALHMVEVASEQSIDLARLPIEKIIVAGEPGGSIPSVRNRIEQAWQAKVTDHSGASEIGAWGYGDAEGKGLYINESEFLAEFIAIDSGQPAIDGELAQLVITTLGRAGCPVIRYRTGDLVRPRRDESGFVFLEGGVLGRTDDMMVIRGVNVFPSAIEEILRSFPEVVEFRLTARKRGEMDELVVEVEDHMAEPERIANELQLKLGLRTDVRLAPAMSLPRTEHKSNRFVDLREE